MELSHVHIHSLRDLCTGILGKGSVSNGVEKPDSIFDVAASESALHMHESNPHELSKCIRKNSLI